MKPLVVGGWLADRDGVGFYRLKVPLDELERRGHSVEYNAAMRWQLGKRPSSHVLVGQRVSNEGTSAQWQAAAGDVRRVFEVDDDLCHLDPTSAKAFEYYQRPGIKLRLLQNIRSADAVTVSTDYLADVIRDQYAVEAPIHVVPNCIEPWVLDLAPVTQAGPMTVGYAGSDTHAGDFDYVRGPLRRFFARHQGMGVTFAGVDYRHVVGAPWGKLRPWRSIWDDARGYYEGLSWQVGIAPLAPTQFCRCKSDLKALEYAARGIVIVASDIEPYSRFVNHGVDGFLVKRPHEWVEYLEALAEDPELRAKMGAAAREKAAARTIDKWVHLWESAFRGDA